MFDEPAFIPVRLTGLNKAIVRDVQMVFTRLEGNGRHAFMVEGRDITEHNRHVRALRTAIEDLRKANEDLESRVRVRTAELHKEIENAGGPRPRCGGKRPPMR